MKDKKFSTFLLLILIFGFISSFAGGYFLKSILSTETTSKPPSATNKPSSTSLPTPPDNIIEEKLDPGERYFMDTIMAVSKDESRVTLVASVSISEEPESFLQNTRVSFFDGKAWDRDVANKYIPTTTINSDSLVETWNIAIDPSRVLKQSVDGAINFNNRKIAFNTQVLENEIGVRSLPSYTKFMSEGSGKLTVDGTEHEAHILYTRIYSQDASQIQFYDRSLGVTTYWLAYWDNAGNFYHADVTKVLRPSPTYADHKLGILKTSQGEVSKTFDIVVNSDSSEKFNFKFESPINSQVEVTRINFINKIPGGSYDFKLGQIEGTNGFGMLEIVSED